MPDTVLSEAEARVAELTATNAALSQAIDSLVSSDDLLALVDQVARHAIDLTGAKSASVVVFDDVADTLRRVAVVLDGTPIDLTDDVLGEAFPTARMPGWREMRASRAEVWVDWDDPDVRARDTGAPFGRALPLLLRGNVIGYLSLWFDQPADDFPCETMAARCRVYVQQLTLALQSVRIVADTERMAVTIERERAAQHRMRELEHAQAVLARSVVQLSTNRGLGGFLTGILHEALAATGAVSGAVLLLDASGEVLLLHPIAQIIRGEPIDSERRRPLAVSTRTWEAIGADRTLKWRDTLEVATLCCGPGHRLATTLPMLLGDQVIGCIALAHDASVTVEPPETGLWLCWMLARQAALAVRLSRLAEEAQRAAVAEEAKRVAEDRAAVLTMTNDALRESSKQLVTIDDLARYLDELLHAFAHIVGANLGMLAVLHASGDAVDVIATEPLPEMHIPLIGHARVVWDQLSAAPPGGWRGAIGAAPLSEPNAVHYAALGLRYVIRVPVRLRGETLGVLALLYRDEPPDLELLDVLAEHAALAIGMKRLAKSEKRDAVVRARAQAAEERATELASANAALRRSIEMLTSYEDLPSFTGEILQETIRASGADSGSVSLFDEATDTMRRVAVSINGEMTDLASDGGTELGEPFVLWPAAWRLLRETRLGFWVDWEDPSARPPELRDTPPEACAFTQRTCDRFAALLPLVLHGETIGFLTLAFGSFSADRWPFAREISGVYMQQLTLALHSARISESVKSAAIAEERNRLARDIHDTLAQALALIVMQLAEAQERLGSAWESAREPLETVRQIAVSSLAEARLSISVLRPPKVSPQQDGLPTAVRDVTDLVRRYYGGRIDVVVTGTPHAVDPTVQIELVGILREALTNAAKHSGATGIVVELAFPDDHRVQLVVADDGQGFDPDAPRANRYGLTGMSERAARVGAALTLVTEPGAGTQIIVIWPA
jgi:signal transduction histidine kinase